jgi:hypothetical protein
VYPEDKYIVVQHLQAAGRVTGMTGDGVNDAPALRQAEVGIAVSTATDVAKGAASVVLTEPGLTNIVALVEQGRTIYQRIPTWIINKISRTILKAAFVAIAFVVTGKFVVSAFAMLLLVFMTDFAKIALATDHVRLSKKPETWNIGAASQIQRISSWSSANRSYPLPRISIKSSNFSTFPISAIILQICASVRPRTPKILAIGTLKDFGFEGCLVRLSNFKDTIVAASERSKLQFRHDHHPMPD